MKAKQPLSKIGQPSTLTNKPKQPLKTADKLKVASKIPVKQENKNPVMMMF